MRRHEQGTGNEKTPLRPGVVARGGTPREREHQTGGQEAAGSNPLAPTISFPSYRMLLGKASGEAMGRAMLDMVASGADAREA